MVGVRVLELRIVHFKAAIAMKYNVIPCRTATQVVLPLVRTALVLGTVDLSAWYHLLTATSYVPGYSQQNWIQYKIKYMWNKY